MEEGESLRKEIVTFMAARGKPYPERPTEVKLDKSPRQKRGPALEPEIIQAHPPHQRKGGEPLSV